MERYGCLVIGVILALIILVVTVYYWSGWLNRPVGHSPVPALTLTPNDAGLTTPMDRMDSGFWLASEWRTARRGSVSLLGGSGIRCGRIPASAVTELERQIPAPRRGHDPLAGRCALPTVLKNPAPSVVPARSGIELRPRRPLGGLRQAYHWQVAATDGTTIVPE